MSTHKHTIVKGAPTTASATVPDPAPFPDLSVYAKAADLKALTAHTAALEASMANVILSITKFQGQVTPPVPPTPEPPPGPPPPTPTPAPRSLQSYIDGATAGSRLDLSAWSFTAGATVNKALTIVGGTVNIASTATSGVIVTASNVTLDGMTIKGPGDSVYDSWDYSSGIIAKKATPVSNLVVRNCHVSGFQHDGMFLDHVTNLTVDSNTVTDCVYGGISVLSGIGGTVTNNVVQRIGVHDGAPDGGYKDAYGIVFEQMSPGTDPPCSDFTCSGNTVTDVPRWHGIDTHAGVRIVISGNRVTRCRSGIYITSDGIGNHNHAIDVNGNTVIYGSFTPIPDAHYGITFVYSDDGFDRNNTITGWPSGHAIYPPEGCTNLTVSNNTVNA